MTGNLGDVTALFDRIAPSYNRFTRWFSFGMDRRWKARLAREAAAGLGADDLVLDLACGTGDVGWAVRQAVGQTSGRAVRVVGLDPSAAMLRLAKRPPNRLVRADMLAIPIGSATVALVTTGYGFRNVASLDLALSEVSRVLRSGGHVVTLDFFLPERRWWRRLFRWYLRLAGRAAGRWLHREPETYGYIARSLDGWVTPAEFSSSMAWAGLRLERTVRWLGGGICVHVARKP